LLTIILKVTESSHAKGFTVVIVVPKVLHTVFVFQSLCILKQN